GAGQGTDRTTRHPEACTQECADPDPYRAGPHGCRADLRRRGDGDRLRPAGCRKPRRLGRAAARLPGHPGSTPGDRRARRADQFCHRHALPGCRPEGALLMADIVTSKPATNEGMKFLRRLLKRKTVAAGVIVLAIFVLLAVLAPLVAPYNPSKLSIVNRLKPPSEIYWFGTDEFGRDIFSRTKIGRAH